MCEDKKNPDARVKAAAGGARTVKRAGAANVSTAVKRKVVSASPGGGAGGAVAGKVSSSAARADVSGGAANKHCASEGGAGAGRVVAAKGAELVKSGAAKKEKVERRHRAEFENMLGRHVEGSLWLKSREPLLMALSDLAMFEDSSDSVRFRAMEKVEELLEKAEDEKKRETTGNVSEGLEASVRRLERALRRGARDRDD